MRRSFAFLQSEHGFYLRHDHAIAREVNIEYERPAARVSIFYEAFSEPDVTVSLRIDGKWLQFSLGLILVHSLGNSVPLDAVRAAPSLPAKVQMLADLTRKYARPLLMGDPWAIKSLRTLRAEWLRKRVIEVREENKRRGFTSTGETPRFTTRPTLAQLFAGTPNASHRMVRIYQAVWDYHYSLQEVATFLGMTKDAVQSELDRWEHITVGYP